MPVIIFISLAILFQLILSYTKYGKHCYAIGSNEEAARISGIKVEHHKLLVYVDCRDPGLGRRTGAELQEPDRPGRHGRDV